MPIPLGVLAVAGAGAAGGAAAYELIQTTVLTTTASSVTFSNIPQDYKHLQIRAVAKSNESDFTRLQIRANGVSSGVYTSHNLRGNGSTVTTNTTTISATSMLDMFWFPGTFFEGENQFGAAVMDILDYANTSKNTTFRSLHGYRPSSYTSYIFLSSGLYNQTTAVSSLELSCQANSMVSGSRFSLYGIKG